MQAGGFLFVCGIKVWMQVTHSRADAPPPGEVDPSPWVAGTTHLPAAAAADSSWGKIFAVRQVCNKVFWISVSAALEV